MPIVMGMLVTPGVAFDLSVNRESSAFMGSILEADVNSRLDFIAIEFTGAGALKERPETIKEIRFLQSMGRERGGIGHAWYITYKYTYLSLFSSAVLLGEVVVVGSWEGRRPSELAVLESEEI